jgi:hypothetical protein
MTEQVDLELALELALEAALREQEEEKVERALDEAQLQEGVVPSNFSQRDMGTYQLLDDPPPDTFVGGTFSAELSFRPQPPLQRPKRPPPLDLSANQPTERTEPSAKRSRPATPNTPARTTTPTAANTKHLGLTPRRQPADPSQADVASLASRVNNLGVGSGNLWLRRGDLLTETHGSSTEVTLELFDTLFLREFAPEIAPDLTLEHIVLKVNQLFAAPVVDAFQVLRVLAEQRGLKCVGSQGGRTPQGYASSFSSSVWVKFGLNGRKQLARFCVAGVGSDHEQWEELTRLQRWEELVKDGESGPGSPKGK